MAIDVEVDTSELERWPEVVDAFHAGLRVAVDDATNAGEIVARRAAPVRTGALRNSIESSPAVANGSGAAGDLRVTAEHATYVSEGTRPHVIEPRRARALRWEEAGQVRFARRVQHPGTKPDLFLEVAKIEIDDTLRRSVLEQMRRTLGRF